MKLLLLCTNGVYSHKLCFDGCKEAFQQIKREDSTFDFLEHNICKQDDPTIDQYKPDWIFVISPLASGFRVHHKYRNKKVAIYDTESLYEPSLQRDSMRYANVAFTVDRRGTQYFNEWALQNKVNCKTYHMPLGFSPNIYCFQDIPETYKSDVCIVGVMFNRRRDILEMLYSLRESIRIRVICPKDWQGKIIHKDGIVLQDTQNPIEMGKYMAGAKINLCINRDYDPANDSGIKSTTPGRVFQETACRRMVMIDDTRPEVYDYFENNKEIVTFKVDDKGEDLRNKIMYYLTNNMQREEIAHNGYVRTMKENTWYHRMKYMLEILKQQNVQKTN